MPSCRAYRDLFYYRLLAWKASQQKEKPFPTDEPGEDDASGKMDERPSDD